MSLTIELPKDAEEALRQRADAEGLTVEECVLKLVSGGLGIFPPASEQRRKTLGDVSRMVRKHFEDVPREAFDSLPRDGASEVDHYIYGVPKRNE